MGILKNCHSRHCHSEARGRGICFFLPASKYFTSLALVLLCATTTTPATAEELGRLFLTPLQRQDLDRRRASNRAEEEAPEIREGPLMLDGHVQRSSGKSATWINGVPQYDSHTSRDPTRLTLIPNEGEPGVSLKVGQIYERTSGVVRDPLAGGEIRVGKRPAPATGRTKR